MKFKRELYPKTALLKAAYNFTDRAYIHLDADEEYFIVTLENKSDSDPVSEKEFINEMLTQSVRHEVYLQTKNIRELLLARSMATSVVVNDEMPPEPQEDTFNENEILKDWFEANESN